MSETFNTYQDPVLFYNGGYQDHEDDIMDSKGHIHIFNPFMKGAVLDAYRHDTESGLGKDPNPQIDTWVERQETSL